MENTKIIETLNPDGTTTEHVIIERAPGEFTSMPKNVYDEMIANQENGTL